MTMMLMIMMRRRAIKIRYISILPCCQSWNGATTSPDHSFDCDHCDTFSMLPSPYVPGSSNNKPYSIDQQKTPPCSLGSFVSSNSGIKEHFHFFLWCEINRTPRRTFPHKYLCFNSVGIPRLREVVHGYCSLKLTASLPLKMDGWNTILSYRAGLFSGAFAVSFREGTC